MHQRLGRELSGANILPFELRSSERVTSETLWNKMQNLRSGRSSAPQTRNHLESRLFLSSDLKFHMSLLVNILLYHIVFGQRIRRKAIQDPLFVFGNIIFVWRIGVPLDRFTRAGVFFEFPGVGMRGGAAP